MNFTWFAASYDTDDSYYRIAVFAQLVGTLILAAGIDKAFNDNDFRLGAIGYVIMRMSLVGLWLRVMKSNPQDKEGALRYALGITLCQVAWVLLVFLVPKNYLLVGFVTLMICEHIVPFYADLKKQTRWHRHHMIERYGLLTIIVLGEALLASTNAMKALADSYDPLLLSALIGGLLILFSMWWLYFEETEHPRLKYSPKAFVWGYGHYFIFGAVAATGASLEAVTDQITGQGTVSLQAVNVAVAICCALYLFSLAMVHDVASDRKLSLTLSNLVAAGLILLTPFIQHGVLAIGIIIFIAVVIRLKLN